MLNRTSRIVPRESGVMLLFTLIILVLMTLGGIALMRSMNTTNMIAGNMAFQQSTTQSADTGVEAAIAWLESNNAISGVLYTSLPSFGYSASSTNLTSDQLGEEFWNLMTPGGVCYLPLAGNACSASHGLTDAAGNNVSFMIQRLCNGTGDPTSNSCEIVPGSSAATATANSGSNEGAGEEVISSVGVNTSVYYRITVRVIGPRNTTSYIQSIVSM